MPSFTFSSDLPVPFEKFLTTLTMSGVNAELSPLVRMTAPESFSVGNILDWPEQQELFQSWILLFGFLPIDRHAFFLEGVNRNEGFSERSTSLTNEYWCHKRKVVSTSSGCRVTDTVRFKSRIPLIDVLFKPSYQVVFWCRHRNLRRRYRGSAS